MKRIAYRLQGMALCAFSLLGELTSLSLMGLGNTPGAMELTLIPLGASSTAIALQTIMPTINRTHRALNLL